MSLTALDYPIERPKMIVKSQIVNQSMIIFQERLKYFGQAVCEQAKLRWPSAQSNEPRICSPSVST